MEKISEHSFRLKCTGRIITSADLDTLATEELTEVLETPVTIFDVLSLRKMVHNIGNFLQGHVGTEKEEFQKVNNTLAEIQKSLVVTVVNGTTHDHKIGDLLIDLYNLHASDRKRNKLYEILFQYKYHICFVICAMIGLTIYHHNLINFYLKQAGSYLIPIVLGASFISPILVMIIAKIFGLKK